MKSFLKAASLVALLSASGGAVIAQSGAAIDGRWDAVISHNGIDIPFRLDISGEGQSLKGTFYDGFKPYDGTTSASFQDGKLTLNIEHYLTTIDASLNDGKLSGTAATAGRGPSGEYVFQATRHVEQATLANAEASIAGSWLIPLDAPSSKGEKRSALSCSRRAPKWRRRSCASMATPARTAAVITTANGCLAISMAAAPA